MIRKSSDSFLISNKKNQNQVLKLFKKTIDIADGGVFWFARLSLQTMLYFVSSFLKQENQKIFQQFFKKIGDPDDGLFCRQRQNMSPFLVPVPNVASAWESASLLKHRAAIVQRVPGKQRED